MFEVMNVNFEEFGTFSRTSQFDSFTVNPPNEHCKEQNIYTLSFSLGGRKIEFSLSLSDGDLYILNSNEDYNFIEDSSQIAQDLLDFMRAQLEFHDVIDVAENTVFGDYKEFSDRKALMDRSHHKIRRSYLYHRNEFRKRIVDMEDFTDRFFLNGKDAIHLAQTLVELGIAKSYSFRELDFVTIIFAEKVYKFALLHFFLRLRERLGIELFE